MQYNHNTNRYEYRNSRVFGFFGTKKAQLPPRTVHVTGKQVHGDRIRTVNGMHPPDADMFVDATDALVTNHPGVLLTVRTADCVPLIAFDTQNRIIAVAHCGWQGTKKKLPSKLIAAMVEEGASIENIELYIGPGICKNHYCVPLERCEVFYEAFGSQVPGVYLNGTQGSLDLHEIIRFDLEGTGLPSSAIHSVVACTFDDENHFYSYRREQASVSGHMHHGVILL